MAEAERRSRELLNYKVFRYRRMGGGTTSVSQGFRADACIEFLKWAKSVLIPEFENLS